MKKDVPLFCSEIRFMNPVKQEKSEAVVASSYKGKGGGSAAYGRAQKVESVEVTDEWVEMYDVINSETGRFAANGIVVYNSSADIAKLALVYVREEVEGLDARLINSIHDEFVIECAEEQATEVSEKTQAAMVRAGRGYPRRCPSRSRSKSPASGGSNEVGDYVRFADYPWRTSTHKFLQKWPPGRGSGPPYPIICT